MADVTEGWDGTVNESGMARILGAATAPRIVEGGTISVVSGQRRVVLSPIQTHHAFIRHQNTDPTTYDLPVPAQGKGQWFLLAERRDWNGNTVVTRFLPGPETDTNRDGISYPAGLPDGFRNQPGVVADMGLYWAWVRSTDNLVVTAPVTRGRPYPAGTGRNSTEQSGIINIKDSARVLNIPIGVDLPAGTVLHFWGQAELYCPPGNYGGNIMIVREYPGGSTIVGSVRWHTHDRGGRWLFPIVDVASVLGEDLAPNVTYGLYISNDPGSAGGVEMWFPRASWFSY